MLCLLLLYALRVEALCIAMFVGATVPRSIPCKVGRMRKPFDRWHMLVWQRWHFSSCPRGLSRWAVHPNSPQRRTSRQDEFFAILGHTHCFAHAQASSTVCVLTSGSKQPQVLFQLLWNADLIFRFTLSLVPMRSSFACIPLECRLHSDHPHQCGLDAHAFR